MINTIYVCDSFYQIIVASCIQKQFMEESVIILTDHIPEMYEVYLRMRVHSSLFRSVFYIKTKAYNQSKFTDAEIDQDITNFLKENKLTRCKNLRIGTLERYMRRLFKVLKVDFGQENICGGIIEDGFATYSFYGDVINEYKYKDDLKEIYIYDSLLLAWKPDSKIIEIKRCFFKEAKFVEELNNIFGYYDLEDEYREKYIVLASGYEEIAQLNNLKEILMDLEKIVGKNNILIKMHPRVKNNIYSEYGYKTNKNISVPWEIIALNQDLSEKVVISTYSGSLYTPRILFDKKMTGISIIKFSDQEDPFNLCDYYEDYVLANYSECFYMPDDRNAYKELLVIS